MRLRNSSTTKQKPSEFTKNKRSNVNSKSNPIPSSSSASAATATASTSRGTFSSAVSSCWNTNSGTSTASTSLTKPSTSAMASGSNQQLQTAKNIKCMLCFYEMILIQQKSFNANTRLHKLLINLCKNLEISTNEILDQSQCTQFNFPLCEFCEPMLVELWEQQQILDDVRLKIQKIKDGIEQVVADAEILGSAANRPGLPSVVEVGQRMSSKLREFILNSYRNKVIRKRQEEKDQHNAIRPEIIEPSPEDVKPLLIAQTDTENFTSALSYSAEILNENSIESDYLEDSEELPPTLIRHDIVAPYNGGGDDNEDNQEPESFPEGVEIENPENSMGSVDTGVVARYNDANTAMAIPNENAGTGALSVIQVKQERSAAAVEEYDDDDDDDSDEDGDVFSLAERKRRFLFEGVEIYTATEARSKVDYLQCSLCSYMLPIKKYNTSKVSSPYMKMKTHILYVHKGKSGAPKAPRVRKLSCIPCDITFSNLAEFREHKAQHPPGHSFECNICGKPYKEGRNQYNLLKHKFTHKNDDERKISLAAGERGSYNCMLSSKLNKALTAGKGPVVPRLRRRKPVIKTGNSRPSAAEVATDRNPRRNERVHEGNGTQFKCQICERVFGKKCHLIRHMSSHTLVGSLRDQPTPSTSTGYRASLRRRQTVGDEAEPVRAALPPPPPPVHSNLVNSNVIGDSGSRIYTLFDRRQRVAVGDGTEVIVKREVLEFLMNK
ncbi:unnamed protein product [Orchesella dallaii]|uniref:C2H2-type domain-containing protein n=1 Tax=Orchesella dallaii TaxID=48710 RepID=A0ABP1PTE8_9HEXA